MAGRPTQAEQVGDVAGLEPDPETAQLRAEQHAQDDPASLRTTAVRLLAVRPVSAHDRSDLVARFAGSCLCRPLFVPMKFAHAGVAGSVCDDGQLNLLLTDVPSRPMAEVATTSRECCLWWDAHVAAVRRGNSAVGPGDLGRTRTAVLRVQDENGGSSATASACIGVRGRRGSRTPSLSPGPWRIQTVTTSQRWSRPPGTGA
jgi:hypothetical protein